MKLAALGCPGGEDGKDGQAGDDYRLGIAISVEEIGLERSEADGVGEEAGGKEDQEDECDEEDLGEIEKAIRGAFGFLGSADEEKKGQCAEGAQEVIEPGGLWAGMYDVFAVEDAKEAEGSEGEVDAGEFPSPAGVCPVEATLLDGGGESKDIHGHPDGTGDPGALRVEQAEDQVDKDDECRGGRDGRGSGEDSNGVEERDKTGRWFAAGLIGGGAQVSGASGRASCEWKVHCPLALEIDRY